MWVCLSVHLLCVHIHVHGVFILCGKWQLIGTSSLQPISSWLWWIPSSIKGMIITPLPFIHITRGTHPWIDGKSDLSMERPIHTFTDDCVHPSTITAFIGITGSYQGDIVSATLQPLRQSEHLTAVIYDLAVLYCPFFFFPSATLKTSTQPHAA